MAIAARVLQFVGIVLVGVGLIYGIANDDLGREWAFAFAGLGVFVVGRMMQPR